MLGQYSNQDQERTRINEAEAVRVPQEKYEMVRAMFRPDTPGGFDYPRRRPFASRANSSALIANRPWISSSFKPCRSTGRQA